MESCVFCKIVKGELPSYKTYEDNNFLGFLDIFPRVKGHSILIPKKHYRWVYDVPNFGAYWKAALRVTKDLQNALNPEFITYVTHGLDVPHAHIHILPRERCETAFVPENKKFTKEEMEKVAKKIRAQR